MNTLAAQRITGLRPPPIMPRAVADVASLRSELGPKAGAPTVTAREMSRGQSLSAARERRLWDRRAESWDTEASAALGSVIEAVLAACKASDEPIALDLGCGSGQVTLPLSSTCERVIAVDISAASLERLKAKAHACGVSNIEAVASPLEALELPSQSVDLIVTNYVLHHLRDADKVLILRRSFEWLRPGGRLVIGDMMFGRGGSAEDRAIIASKARSFVRRGPAGWWRLAKNVVRFSFRVREKPMTAERWELLLGAAGYEGVSHRRVVAEACVMSASKPALPRH